MGQRAYRTVLMRRRPAGHSEGLARAAIGRAMQSSRAIGRTLRRPDHYTIVGVARRRWSSAILARS